MTDLEVLEAQVRANTDLENSALELIKGIAERIDAAIADPVRVRALTAQLKMSADALAAAVAANTK